MLLIYLSTNEDGFCVSTLLFHPVSFMALNQFWETVIEPSL